MIRMNRFTALLIVLPLLCSSARPYTSKEAEAFLETKYPYCWRIEPEFGFPWISRDMPQGFAFTGEFAVEELTPPQGILKFFPEAQFFTSKLKSTLATDDPVLVGVTPTFHKGPAALVPFPHTGQNDFFDLFAGRWFYTQADRREFSEALARLVSYTFDSGCKWLPANQFQDEVQVACSDGKIEYVVRVFFSFVGLRQNDDSGHYAGAIIQMRPAAPPALEGVGP